MDEIRCPNCGQINTAGASTCSKCQASLQPNRGAPARPEPAGAQDWLSDLRSGSTLSSDESSPGETFSDEAMDFGQDQTSPDEIPEWLARIRERTRSEGSVSPLGNPLDRTDNPDNDIPDWLKALSPDESSSSWGLQETPFLADFSQAEPEPPARTPAEKPASAPSGDDWLGDFRSNVQFSSNPANEIPDSTENSPAWPESTISDQTGPDAGFTPWDQPEIPQPGEPSAPEGTAAPQEPPTQGDDAIPDWMKDFDPFSFADSPAPAETSQENPPIETSGTDLEIPDWLSSGAESLQTPSSTVSTNSYFVDAPDWLTENSGPEAALPQDQGAPEPQGQEPAVSPAPTSYFEDTLPDQDVPSIDPNEIPDWLKSDEPFEPSTGADSIPVLRGSLENPDWLAAAPQQQEPADGSFTPAASSTSAFVGNLSEEEIGPKSAAQPMPEWLTDVNPEPPAGVENTPAFIVENDADLSTSEPVQAQPFSTENIPDWLGESEAETGAEPEPEQPILMPPVSGEEEEELAPAQLPGWLHAMRPVEAIAPAAAVNSDDRRIENNGPLAGLQGVLPGENLARRYRKPPAYSVKLRISEKQRAYATQLEQMLGDEQKPQAGKTQPGGLPRWIIRAALALVLIAAIVFSVPGSSVPQASLEMLNFSNQIEALPNQAPVLLAIEYDAGFAGEMRLASQGLVERLLAHNTRIAIVSTVASGPVLGNELIESARQDLLQRNETGAANTQTVNLGYLPGGITSLQEFSLHPQIATQYGFASNASAPAWNQDVLSGVSSIDSFSAVIVLTDDGDTGRAWVEQVKPHLGSTPLFFVSSAQAAPVLQPYADSGQIDSLIAGLSDGMAYNRLVQSNLDLYPWGAYRGSLYLGIGFILIGILSKAMLSALPRRKA